eukprot:SM000090S24334  [mRNA]  locus=s90:317892:322600:- [translate_table: standard]
MPSRRISLSGGPPARSKQRAFRTSALVLLAFITVVTPICFMTARGSSGATTPPGLSGVDLTSVRASSCCISCPSLVTSLLSRDRGVTLSAFHMCNPKVCLKTLRRCLLQVLDVVQAEVEHATSLQDVSSTSRGLSSSWIREDLGVAQRDPAHKEGSIIDERSLPGGAGQVEAREGVKSSSGVHGLDKSSQHLSESLTSPGTSIQFRRLEKRLTELTAQDEEGVEMKEHTGKKSPPEGLAKYNIWKKEGESDGGDQMLRLMRDQLIMARGYIAIAQQHDNQRLVRDLKARIRDCHRAMGEASSDAELPSSATERMRAMGHLLAKARDMHYDCTSMVKKLRAMVQTAEEQGRMLKKQSTFLSQLAAKTVPKALHCLSLRLTLEYFELPPHQRTLPGSDKLEDDSLHHCALFTDNVLAAAVVVNSSVTNAKDSSKLVFHLVTDKLNYGAMKMWFLMNTPLEATISVQRVEDFKWLNSSYCPVLRQLESAAMKEYYFKADRPLTMAAGSSNLKYRNPKYLSMLNHLRFYLPEVFPKLQKILFLDDDIVVQKDLGGLWEVDLQGQVNGAVETCGASFHRFDKYLNFSNPLIAENFNPQACGWAYGMNMFDLWEWKRRNITGIYHYWQELNEDRTLWKLGTLPPGLITFYNKTYPLDKSWHVLGLGYNPNLDMTEVDNAAVIHWNGNMKPWLEIALSKFKPYWNEYVMFDQPFLQACNING